MPHVFIVRINHWKSDKSQIVRLQIHQDCSSCIRLSDSVYLPKSYSTGQVVYFDPVSENECNATKFNINNIKSGSSTCYKWYVISTGNDLKGESLKKKF